MRQFIDSINSIENTIADHSNDARVVNAAKRLQLALLAAAAATIRPARKSKLVHGLTRDEAEYARTESVSGGCSGKIRAIKMVRERTGLGLREAKDHVENYMMKVLGFKHWPTVTTDAYKRPAEYDDYR